MRPSSHAAYRSLPTTTAAPDLSACAPERKPGHSQASALSCLFPRARTQSRREAPALTSRHVASAPPGKTARERTAQTLVSLLAGQPKDSAKLARRTAVLLQRATGDLDDQALLPMLQRLKPKDLNAVRASIAALAQDASADPLTQALLPVLSACVDAVASARFKQCAETSIQALLQKNASPAALKRALQALAEPIQALPPQANPDQSLKVVWHALPANELLRLNHALSKLEQQQGAKLAPASMQALTLLKTSIIANAASALQQHGTELLDALSTGDVAKLERHGQAMQEHYALLAAQSDPFTALENLPSFPHNAPSVKAALARQLQPLAMWQLAAQAASMPLLRHALRQVFGMDLPALPGSHSATDNALQIAEELIVQPASADEQKPEKVGDYNVGWSFYKDVKRNFDLRLADGTPLIPDAKPGMDDATTHTCIIAAMPTLVDICHDDLVMAQALTTLSSQTLFASLTTALGLSMLDKPEILPVAGIYSVGFRNVGTRPSLERRMIQFVKTDGNPELILHYQAEGGKIATAEMNEVQLDAASWQRATVRIKLVSANPATFKILGTPTFELMLHAPVP